MPRNKHQTVAPINWTTNNSTLIWSLLTELAKKENHVALYGVQKGEKTLGSSKAKVHKQIASALFPDIYAGNEETLGSRVKGQIEHLYTRYKKELKRISVTGGGLGGNDEDLNGFSSQDEISASYIGADGPDITTTAEARNIWEKILQGFPFFAEMHRHLCGRPNTVPPIVTTGVGPGGRHVIQFQPIETPQPVAEAAHELDEQSDVDVSPALAAALTVDLTTPARPSIAIPDGKENLQPVKTEKKRTPKESSFTVTEAFVEKAKSSIQRIAKKSFEERLADATEASLRRADERAASSLRLEKKRFILEQLNQISKKRDQIIAARQADIYSAKEAKRQLKMLEEREADLQRPSKRVRVRSPSPTSSFRASSPLVVSSPVMASSSPFHSPRQNSPEWAISAGHPLPSE